METEMNEGSSRIQHVYSNPRRYSFLLGEGAHVKTPRQFLFELGQVRERKDKNKRYTLKEDLFSRFSVEALTQQFYDKLYHWYQWAIEESTGVYFPNKPDTATDDRDAIGSNMIRLVTRLLFVWFIKQKGLVPEEIFDERELDKILVDFNPEASDSSNYYNAILQNLFFATLNSEITKRAFTKPDFQGASSSYGVKTLFRDNKNERDTFFKISHEEFLKLFHHVPYMNCGLFECLDKYSHSDIGQEKDLLLDGFSTKTCRDNETGHYKYRAFVPNSLFFAPEHKVTVTTREKDKIKKEEIKVQGLITLLKDYNFTVEENTPTEVQVSLDPELLGRVFENLLAAYNPETGDSVRKSTGSFYTPREIVEYMVNESLIEYLKSKVDNGKTLEGEFRKLVDYQDHDVAISDAQKEECLKALYDCKVLDPACGSGAFPMGMLQQMVHIIKQLDSQNDKWHQIVLDKAAEESRKAFQNENNETRKKKLNEIDEEFNDDMTNPDYKRKLYIIQNCIYGVDIQPIAMLICKLRFFISLVCEQDKIDFNKPESNFGINTLPNLETKFVSANTLLSPAINGYTGDWTVDEHLAKLKEDLLEIRMRHFKVKTQMSKQKNRGKDEAKRKEILEYIVNSASTPDEDLIKRNKDLIKEYFSELDKYREKKMKPVKVPMSLWGEEQEVLMDENASKRREYQDRIKACESEIKREENKKNPVGFEAAVQQVTEWNPYDQNASAPFFSPEWMFGMTDGFDVVIGNPPYIQLQADRSKLARLYAPCGFDTFKGSGDIYCLFYEKGNYLLKDGGLLCFITSNKWMRAGYGDLLRKYLTAKTAPTMVIDFGETHVFDAMVMTNILMFKKERNNFGLCATQVKEDFVNRNAINQYVEAHHIFCHFEGDESWVIMPDEMRALKKKVEAKGVSLEKWKIDIYRGVLTGFDKAFWITSEEREEILESCETKQEKKLTEAIIKPLLRGKDIRKYGCQWAELWLIGTFPSKKIDIKNVPSIRKHLLTFTKERLEQTGKKYIVNGEEIKSRKKTNGEWFETQDSITYWKKFEGTKIVYPETSKFLPFYYDEGEFYANKTCFIMTGEHLCYLTAIFNSSLFKYCFRENFPVLFGGARGLSKQFFEELPIMKVDDKTELEFHDLVQDIQNDFSREKAKEIDNKIFDLYGLNEHERQLVGYIDYHDSIENNEKNKN